MPVHDAAAGPQRLRLLLTPDVDAPAAARRALRALPLGAAHDDVLLLTSELVSNAVVHAGLHAGQPIELDVECADAGDRIRVRVRDHGRGFAPGVPGDGHGLRMIAAVTPNWGVEQDGGTCVWFELAAT